MTYTAPALQLIGAAQNLVLGDGINNSQQAYPICAEDSLFQPTSDENEAW